MAQTGGIPPARSKTLFAFARSIGYSVRDLRLLDQALTHRSLLNEARGLDAHPDASPGDSSGASRLELDNQRLEYLGDSVLGLIVNEALYRRNPEFTEGQLARIKSAVVSESSLAPVGRELGIGPVLAMGRGETSSGGADRPSNLADALEAVIAAIYLDRGLPAAQKFVLSALQQVLQEFEDPRDARDAKSMLQEFVQQESGERPRYEVVSQSGPDHAREFEYRVLVNGAELGRGRGASRKRAEQAAAEFALNHLEALTDSKRAARPENRRRPAKRKAARKQAAAKQAARKQPSRRRKQS